MVGALIDGKAEAAKVRSEVAAEVERIRASSDPDFTPGLAIVQVGDRCDSGVYIRNKLRAAEKAQIKASHHQLPATASESEVAALIRKLNADASVHGIILQLPLETSEPMNADALTELIAVEKDVDGLTETNAGRLARNDPAAVVPCTPKGCLRLLQTTGVKMEGARALVIGRSAIVGAPAALLLRHNDATVTVAHSRSKDLPQLCKEADILLVGIGKAEMIKGDWLKPGVVVIDCGINVLKGAGEGGKDKLVGDVEFASAKEVASHITPVPGGVGPMTVAMLLRNTLQAAIQAKKTVSDAAAEAGLLEKCTVH